MKTSIVTLLSLFTASLAFAAVSLIDTNLRNGSFENGDAAPWLGDAQVIEDPLFASDGTRFAVLQGMPSGNAHARKIAFQFFQTGPTNGRAFVATFNARASAIGFDVLSVDFFARSSAGVFTSAVETPIKFPALSSSEWRTFQVQYVLPENWDGDGVVSLQILFSKPGAAAGISYTGYLDRVQLQALTTPLPQLTIVRTNQALTISWPGSGTNFVLEAASELSASTVWQRVTNSPSSIGGNLAITLAASLTKNFFRLKSEP